MAILLRPQTDPRTDQVQRAAEDVDHYYCGDCWMPGEPMMCGKPDRGEEECTEEDCRHPACPLCVIELKDHMLRIHGVEDYE